MYGPGRRGSEVYGTRTIARWPGRRGDDEHLAGMGIIRT